MQQYIVIPELGCLVRKDASDGRHFAYFGLGSRWGPEICLHQFRSGDRNEGSLIWDTARAGLGYTTISFKEPS